MIEFRPEQPEQRGLRIRSEDLIAPVVRRDADQDTARLLCLYMGTAGPFTNITQQNLGSFREHMRVPDECKRMGGHVVLVHNAREFIDRFISAVKQKNYKSEGRLVSYYDPRKSFRDISCPIFAKQCRYVWQREYRCVVFTNAARGKPLILDVGDLNDICKIVSSGSINVDAHVQ